MPLSGVSATTSITVPINGKPTCEIVAGQPKCWTITTVDDKFGSDLFNAAATGFRHDAPLTYEFGRYKQVGVRSMLQKGPSSSFSYSSLPVGESVVYVCASDDTGSITCQDERLSVQAPPANFKPSDGLNRVDVNQMINTGDPNALAGGAQALGSLVSLQNLRQKGKGRRLAEDAGTSTEDDEAFARSVQAKVNSIIGALHRYSYEPYMMFDKEGMTQVG